MSRSVETLAHVAVAHTDADLFAHVELDLPVRAGDRVRVHGAPIRVGFGEEARFTRTATLERASPLVRLWTWAAGHFALTHLYEVSFSGRKLP